MTLVTELDTPAVTVRLEVVERSRDGKVEAAVAARGEVR